MICPKCGYDVDEILASVAEARRDTLHDISRQIRGLPTTFGPDIPISEAALLEREAIASFIDEVAG